MIKVGIIGYGKMGKIRANVVEKSQLGKIVAVFDEFEVESEYPVYEKAEDIINDKEIDAVFICTPNFLNKPLTIQSLVAGKHVFCEKPPAFTAKEVEEIIAAEKESGKKLMYGLNHRHHKSVQQMKEMIDSGEYGKVLWMRGRYGKSVDKNFYNEWRAKKELAGGGIFLDQGIHMLDLFYHVGGGFDEAHAFVSNLYWNLDVEDNVFAIFKNNETGVVASLHSTMTQWRHLFSLEVFLEKGYFVLNGLKTSSGTYGNEVLTIAKNRTTAPAATWEDEERITFHVDESWESEVGEFFNAITKNLDISSGNSKEIYDVMKIVDKVYECNKVDKSE